jgi:dipeptidyl aminopeptidase/acylaminoacyl peptidase
MSESPVTFMSDGLKLKGVLHVPDGPPGKKYPAFMVLHGFGSNCLSHGCIEPSRMFEKWGYAMLRFDMRGCGESEGEKANLICLEQVEDTKNALTFLQSHPSIDPNRIGCMGSSFGGAVTCYTAGVDKRVAAAISAGGWGHGEKKFRGQHPTPEAWKKFTDMLAAGKKHRAETGKSLMVPRYDIVPIPPHLRNNVNSTSHQMMTAETAQSMFDFMANDVVGNIAPRPLLLLHPAKDSVTPTEQSIGLFEHANQPTEMHLISDADHFLMGENNPRVVRIIKDWLDQYFPA